MHIEKLLFVIFCLPSILLTAQEGFISDKSGNGCKSYTQDVKHRYNDWSGQCVDGLISGEGVLKVYSDDTLFYTYTGEVREGRLEGRGTLAFASGIEMSGQFVKNQLEGQGTAFYEDGSSYSGNFKNNRFEGQGARFFTNGRVYVGEFKNGKYEGNATYTTPTFQYQGAFKNNKYHGKGQITYENAPNQEGYFFAGKFVGSTYEDFVAAELKSQKQGPCVVKNIRKSSNTATDNLGNVCNYDFYLYEVVLSNKEDHFYMILAYQFKNQYKGLEIASEKSYSDAVATYTRLSKQAVFDTKYSNDNYYRYSSEPEIAIGRYIDFWRQQGGHLQALFKKCDCGSFLFE